MIKKQSHVHVYQKFPLREKSTMSNENKVWLKKLVKSSETYLKLKSKLQKERDMNKMLMEHLMSMRCVEKDVERILKKVSGIQSYQKSKYVDTSEIYIKEEPGQEPISLEDCESDSELDGGFAKIHISEETKTETNKNVPKQETQTNVEEAVSYVLEEEVVEVEEIVEEVVEVEEIVEEQEEEEIVEEQEEVEEIEEEEVEEIEEEVVDGVLEEDEEQNVFEIEYKGKRYYTTDETNGAVYAVQDDDDIGDQIGNFVKGKLVLL